MDSDLLQRLTHATTDDERAAVVLAMSLAALPGPLQEVLQAAAIPHWFDAGFLDALLGEASDEWYGDLLALSFVEQVPGRGYAIHERTRRPLLHELWQADPARFRALSGRAADYCAAQAAATGVAACQAEAVYHRLVSDPETGVAALRALATRWANYEYHTYDEIEGTVRLAQEQIEAGRLAGAGADWTRLWQARLALLVGRPDLAAEPLAAIAADADGDAYLAAEVAQTRGDALAQSDDRAGMAAAWGAAYDLYRRGDGQDGRLDAYLLAEKMARHGLPLPAAEQVEAGHVPTTPPSDTALRLIDNIEAAWIDGVLKAAVHQSMDLRLARDGGRPANLVFHRPQAVDQPLGAGQRLSRLFAVAGRSLLILGAPGSGKTITLLQLLDELLQAARADGRAPIPLLFNLSSFAPFARDKETTLTDWLAEQAYSQYRLKRETTRERLAAGDRFVLLLDGLDEVSNTAGQREQCITAINEFLRQTPCGLVVCSRISDYQALQNRLALAHALVLQPLSNRQIEAYVRQMEPVGSNQFSVFSDQFSVSGEQDRLGEPDAGAMMARIEGDWQLREALRSPLLLTLYPQAFTALPAMVEAGETVEARRQALFAAYVATVFAQPLPAGEHTRDDAAAKAESIGWLTFLAARMRQLGQSLFFVEELQPTWLPARLVGRYRGLYGLWLGFIIGLIVGLLFGLIDSLRGGLIFGLICGLIIGLWAGVVIWLTTRVQKPWLRAGIGGLNGGLILVLILVLIFGLNGGLGFGLVIGPAIGSVSGLGITLSLGTGSMALATQLRERVRPLRPRRQRISEYTARGIRGGVTVGLIAGLVWGFAFGLSGILGIGPNDDMSLNGQPTFGLTYMLIAALFGALSTGLFGVLIGSLLGFIISFLDTPAVDERPYPGSGVDASLRNALLMTFLAALFFGLPTWFITRSSADSNLYLFLVLINILPPTFTWFGGLAWLQHGVLRFMLARRGWLPWRLVPWLERMVARGLLRRVGGGYIFIHRSLLEYFAGLEGKGG